MPSLEEFSEWLEEMGYFEDLEDEDGPTDVDLYNKFLESGETDPVQWMLSQPEGQKYFIVGGEEN